MPFLAAMSAPVLASGPEEEAKNYEKVKNELAFEIEGDGSADFYIVRTRTDAPL